LAAMLGSRVGCPSHWRLRARFAWRRLIGRHPAAGRRGVAAIDYPQGMPSKEEVVEALRQVEDPELGMDIVELGLFYDAEIEGENVKVQYTLTSMGCPAGQMIQEDIERVVREIPGVGDVTSDLTFEPPWTPDKMSEDAKFILGFG
jgi:metal-sulfur cluster biosynthetic enzyme